jgi:AhpD family alkylhydroperoxidase
MGRYDDFQAYRSKMNCRILGEPAQRGTHPDGAPRPGGTLVTKRFFALDGKTYESGALSAKTKELLGLVASMVLRCDDCIAYHVDQCARAGATDEELWESFDVALIVGGSIVIPHMRRAVEFLDETRNALSKEAATPSSANACNLHTA